MRRGLCAAAGGVLVALAVASPAALAAPPGPPVVTGSISVAMGVDPVSKRPANPPLLSGDFQSDDSNGPVSSVTAVVSWKGPDPSHHPNSAPQRVCPSAQCTANGNGFHIAGFPLAAVAFNGPYHVDATATATNPIFGTTNDAAGADFSAAVPPPNVTGVTATVDKTRQTTVSWDRDASTPDLQSYYVYRKGPGDKDFTAVLQTLQQNTGARLSVVDSGTQYKGGDYLYQIESRRNGASGDGTTVVSSDRTKSQSNKATVPDPPPGTPQPPSTQPPSAGGAPPVVKGTPTGLTRSSGFSGSSSGSSAATTPTSEAVTPDPGFARGLPYAAGSPSPDSGQEGDNSAVAVTPGRHKTDTRGVFIPVAAGAILFVGAFHLRILKRRLDEPVGTALS